MKIVHVACLDFQVVESALMGLTFYETTLRHGIGYGRDGASGELFCNPKTQRTPAATEIQYRHTIFDAGPFAAALKGSALCFIKIPDVVIPLTATVLVAATQNGVEKSRGNFIVLFIGQFGRQRNG
jgi:hypothetical protein